MKTSESIDQIATALAQVQPAIAGEVKKDKQANAGRYGYTYASLATIVATIAKPLGAAGLALVQTVDQDETSATVTTRLIHVSGQWVEGGCRMPVVASGAQAVGSAITYGRRYGLCALLGIAADDDDDGASANAAAPPPTSKPVDAKAVAQILGRMDDAKTIDQLQTAADALKGLDLTDGQRQAALDKWKAKRAEIGPAAGIKVEKATATVEPAAAEVGPPPLTDEQIAAGQEAFGFKG